jgi:hypothetical protein
MIAASGRFDLAFTCTDSANVPTAPTGTPTGVLVKNGTDLGTTVTVTMTSAQGVASCTIPSDAANGDRFYIRISAVISAVTYVLSGPVETVSNSVAQTGDSYARIGAAGAGLTALGDTRLANLDATVSSRLSTVGYTTPLDAAGIRTAVGLASANLDTQLAAIHNDAASTNVVVQQFVDVDGDVEPQFRAWLGLASANLDTQLAAIDDYLDTEVAVIIAKLGTPAGASVSADIAAVKTDTGNLVTRITANLFSGITYLKNWLGTLAGKTADATTLAEVNATTAGAGYSNTTDSLEAIRDRGDAAWIGSGGGLTGANAVTITVTDGTDPVPGATVRVKAGAEYDVKKTDASGVAVFSLDDNTYSVRITADRLSFTPVSLAVTADVGITYAMSPVTVDETAWATGDDLVAYYDATTIGQMLKDDRTAVVAADVPTHPVIGRLLSMATGEVNSALNQAQRYSDAQLAAMPDSSLEYLRWLTVAIAVWHLRQRRLNTNPEQQALDKKIVDEHLNRLRKGEWVLGVPENQEAGIGEAVPFTQADVQRGPQLLRDRMTGLNGAFPKRRFPS